MTIKEIIDELKKLGYDVHARKRSDGGYIIKSINNMTFTGSNGNSAARRILGISLSQARIEQTHFNVAKYIEGQKKKDTLEPEMKKSLRKVQRQWRKGGVKAKVTAKKVKWHIKEGGKEEAKQYLEKMTRYGQGYAYVENVEYLAQYCEDIAKGILVNDELQDSFYKLADFIRSKRETFKEEWIEKVYRILYTCIEHSYDEAVLRQSLDLIYTIIS